MPYNNMFDVLCVCIRTRFFRYLRNTFRRSMVTTPVLLAMLSATYTLSKQNRQVWYSQCLHCKIEAHNIYLLHISFTQTRPPSEGNERAVSVGEDFTRGV